MWSNPHGISGGQGTQHMELMEYLRFGLALLFVIGLISACSWFGRRMGLAPRISNKSGVRRLSVIEVQSVDAKRKLVLIRRDNAEHLLLLNGERDLLIESGINYGGADAETSPPAGAGAPILRRILPFSGNVKGE